MLLGPLVFLLSEHIIDTGGRMLFFGGQAAEYANPSPQAINNALWWSQLQGRQSTRWCTVVDTTSLRHDDESRRRLGSTADTGILLIPRSRLVTVGDCSFPAAWPRTWNSLVGYLAQPPEPVRRPGRLAYIERFMLTNRSFYIDTTIVFFLRCFFVL